MARYTVCANMCDGSDYTRHWHGGDFDDLEEATAFLYRWGPPPDEFRDELDRLVAEGVQMVDIDLQVGLWDNDTGEDVDLITLGFTD